MLQDKDAAPASARTGWYELRPFFEQVDGKYSDMYEIVRRISAFSFFIVRLTSGVTRMFMYLPDASEARVVQGVLKNALMETTGPKAFSASTIAHLKMRRHYALPIAHELAQPLLYSTMEKMGKPCFVAVSARHYDESYQISQFVEKNSYARPPLWAEVLRMFTSGVGQQDPKKRISSHKLMLADLAKEKQRLRHFRWTLAIGSPDVRTARSIVKVLSESDGLVIRALKRDAAYSGEVKKPLLFSSHFCVLSDIELANIVSLPDNSRAYRLNLSRRETYTSGPSQKDAELWRGWKPLNKWVGQYPQSKSFGEDYAVIM